MRSLLVNYRNTEESIGQKCVLRFVYNFCWKRFCSHKYLASYVPDVRRNACRSSGKVPVIVVQF
jgi:hypothetical protein